MKRIAIVGAGMLLFATLHAAEPDSADPQPAVDTSAPRKPADGGDDVRRPDSVAGPAASTASQPSAQQPAAQDGAARRGNADRIELATTQITGNSELPRVMYVVPWKRPELGELGGRPAKSLLDEVLEPVDRDVFRRQNRYYEALRPDGTRDQQ